MSLDKDSILHIIDYLLSNLDTYKQRTYLSIFLTFPDIPIEYSQDESNTGINCRYN